MPDATTSTAFDAREVSDAVRALEAALSAEDATAWVYAYTEDAVFDGGGAHVVQGRPALLEMAKGMKPMRAVSIRPLRTEGSGDVAVMWCEASWTSGSGADASPVEARGMILWRRQADGQWRVAIEQLTG